MLTEEQDGKNGGEAPQPVAFGMTESFIKELIWQCEQQNMYGRSGKFEHMGISPESGVVRYKNVYCQYELNQHPGYQSLDLSIGWFGDGFQIAAKPNMEFLLDRQRFKESKNCLLVFDSSRDLADLCIHELHRQLEPRHSFSPAPTEYTPTH